MTAGRNLAHTNDHVFAFKKIIVSPFQVSAIGKHFRVRIRRNAPASRQRSTF